VYYISIQKQGGCELVEISTQLYGASKEVSKIFEPTGFGSEIAGGQTLFRGFGGDGF
jgi:hypothetical protein